MEIQVISDTCCMLFCRWTRGSQVVLQELVLLYYIPLCQKWGCEEAADCLVSHPACAGLAPGADKAWDDFQQLPLCLICLHQAHGNPEVDVRASRGSQKQEYGGNRAPWCSNQVELPPPASLWKQDLPSQLYKWSLSQISPLSPLPLTFLLLLSASCIDHLFYL